MTAAESQIAMPSTAQLVRALVKEPGHLPAVATLPSSRAAMYAAWDVSAEPEAFDILYAARIEELGDDVVVLSRSTAMFAPENLTWNGHTARGPVAIVRRRADGGFAEIPIKRVDEIAAWMIAHAAGVDFSDLRYHGISDGPGYDTVYVERPAHTPPRYALPHREHKSRIGFSWGFDGASSFDLAASIIHDALALDSALPKSDRVMALYQAFTSDYVATFAASEWVLPGDVVFRWVQSHLGELIDVNELGRWAVPGDL